MALGKDGAFLTSPADDFEKLIDQHARLMAGAIRRVCGRRHQSLIPDIEQEVRLALWKQVGGGKTIDHPVSYIYKTALTTALAVLRRCAPRAETSAPGRIESAAPIPARENLTPQESRRLLTEVLEALAPDQARALKAWLAGFNHKEVARMYGWSESVARHNIYRGLKAASTAGRPVDRRG